jgi:hypothetical protein
MNHISVSWDCFSLSRLTMSGLLLGMVLSVCTCWFHSMVTLPPRLVSTVFCLIVALFPCICWSVDVHSLYHGFLCTVLLPVMGILIWCGLMSHKIIIIIIIINLKVLCTVICNWHVLYFNILFTFTKLVPFLYRADKRLILNTILLESLLVTCYLSYRLLWLAPMLFEATVFTDVVWVSVNRYRVLLVLLLKTEELFAYIIHKKQTDRQTCRQSTSPARERP